MDKEELSEKTWLSLRQAEFYLLHVEDGLSVRDAATEMGIGDGNASKKWSQIKEKYRKSQRTLDLLDLELEE